MKIKSCVLIKKRKKTYKRIYKKLSYPECFIDKSIGLKTEVRYAEEKNITWNIQNPY